MTLGLCVRPRLRLPAEGQDGEPQATCRGGVIGAHEEQLLAPLINCGPNTRHDQQPSRLPAAPSPRPPKSSAGTDSRTAFGSVRVEQGELAQRLQRPAKAAGTAGARPGGPAPCRQTNTVPRNSEGQPHRRPTQEAVRGSLAPPPRAARMDWDSWAADIAREDSVVSRGSLRSRSRSPSPRGTRRRRSAG